MWWERTAVHWPSSDLSCCTFTSCYNYSFNLWPHQISVLFGLTYKTSHLKATDVGYLPVTVTDVTLRHTTNLSACSLSGSASSATVIKPVIYHEENIRPKIGVNKSGHQNLSFLLPSRLIYRQTIIKTVDFD